MRTPMTFDYKEYKEAIKMVKELEKRVKTLEDELAKEKMKNTGITNIRKSA